ncbi:hypothetical protein FS935_22015 [Metabacillus litoralis]|uniref:Uncharacterized protein n=1 Tax=Metabacillus litoralis TaxID=152268 RepID=A0A5C6V9T6_9BACI|nr:hypothetical protein [Metabacillus litoralis]TXC81580.1 hypothetical protein FS935_22015 [Metabacillus litoralis]
MNIIEGVDFNLMMFVGPLIVLAVTISGLCLIYKLIFNRLPKSIDNYLLGGVALLGAYLWVFPMHMGFFEYFKNWGI